MELHQLRYFLAVARTCNFSRAAELCHVSQPSLSQQIMKLEAEVEERLFERTRRSVGLTPAGELLRSHAERVLEEVDQARERLRAARGRVQGRVLVGALPTIAPYYLPKLLQQFGQAHPQVDLVVHEDTTNQLVRAVEAKELDLAVISVPVSGARVVATELFAEDLWLALPAQHRLARRRRVPLAELEAERFILMQEGHCLAGQSLQFCSARGFAPAVSFRSAQMETVQAFVAAGLGLSLVPAMARRAGDRSIVYRLLKGEPPRRAIGWIHRAGRVLPPPVRAFADFLQAAVRA